MESGRGKKGKGPLSSDSESEADGDVDASRREGDSHGAGFVAHAVTKMKIEVGTGVCGGERG
jgi:hypothetical protein